MKANLRVGFLFSGTDESIGPGRMKQQLSKLTLA